MKICLTSDLHGNLPTVPPCDLLIIAGDVCPDKFGHRGFEFPDPDGQIEWIRRDFRAWFERLPCEQVVMTWGNHDWCGESSFTGGGNFTSDAAVETKAGKVWCTPWSNTFGGWALMKAPAKLVEIYAEIPDDVDILVSHQPPYGYGDTIPNEYLIYQDDKNDPHVGSKELAAAIVRVHPKLVVCGHIHGGFGRYAGCWGNEQGIPVYNVSHVDEQYRPVHPVVELDWPL